MRKPGKILIIIALCMIVFGTTLATVAGVAAWNSGMNFNSYWYRNIDVYDARAQTYELSSVTTLELTLINEPVTIVRGGDKVHIEWSQRYDNQYELRAGTDGRLSLSRIQYSGKFFGWINFDLGWFSRSWRSDVEDGSRRPVTVAIPEGMDLEHIILNGVDIRVEMDNIDARRIEANGVNAVIIFRHDDISDYNFETSGIGSTLRVDGRKSSGVIGHFSHTHPGASRRVSVNGVNAELDVRQK